MKKIYFISLFFCTFGLAFMACDKIDEGEYRTEEKPILPEWKGRYVVLEEFSGAKCVNCPDAAKQIHELKEFFKDSLIVIANFPDDGGLTTPFPGSLDLRNATSTEWYNAFQIPSLPSGVVNRNASKALDKDQWRGELLKEFVKPAVVSMTLQATLEGEKLNVRVSADFEADFLAEQAVNLTTIVLEDGLITRQLTHEGVNPEYENNHVMRKIAEADIWGTVFLAQNATERRVEAVRSVDCDPEWDRTNLSVVCLLTDASTREILQAAMVKVGGNE